MNGPSSGSGPCGCCAISVLQYSLMESSLLASSTPVKRYGSAAQDVPGRVAHVGLAPLLGLGQRGEREPPRLGIDLDCAPRGLQIMRSLVDLLLAQHHDGTAERGLGSAQPGLADLGQAVPAAAREGG